ncbi:MAG: S41 family peptidase [Lachnospiraceae bacterium]|nr:S41 family peptidase [Lachnospiraceae bacterium]
MIFFPEDRENETEKEKEAAKITGGTEEKTENSAGTEAENGMEGELSGPEEEQELLIQTLKKQGQRRFFNGMLLGMLLAIAALAVGVFAPRVVRNLLGRGNPGAEVLTSSSTLSKLAEVQELIEAYYLDEVDGEYLEAYLFKGIAAGLEDDYANYYTAEELSSVVDSTKGEYYGIGASIGTDADTGEFYVGEVYEDSPAEEGGLLVNDVVLAVDGEAVDALTLTELVSLIKSKDTFVLSVYRPETEEELELTITCGEVIPTYVTYEMLEDQVGYLILTEFTASAVDQFQEAIEELNSQGMEALIVDLRDNPGGLLTSVCDILDELLPADSLMVYTEDKNGKRVEYTAEGDPSVTCEIAVLVNNGSASASEIFAGAIQDYGLGPIIGTQTYGKGVVQKTYSLSDGSAFKLTVENYYTPNGQEIDGSGITPDIIVEEDSQGETGTEEAAETAVDEAGAEGLAEADDAVLIRAWEELTD